MNNSYLTTLTNVSDVKSQIEKNFTAGVNTATAEILAYNVDTIRQKLLPHILGGDTEQVEEKIIYYTPDHEPIGVAVWYKPDPVVNASLVLVCNEKSVRYNPEGWEVAYSDLMIPEWGKNTPIAEISTHTWFTVQLLDGKDDKFPSAGRHNVLYLSRIGDLPEFVAKNLDELRASVAQQAIRSYNTQLSNLNSIIYHRVEQRQRWNELYVEAEKLLAHIGKLLGVDNETYLELVTRYERTARDYLKVIRTIEEKDAERKKKDEQEERDVIAMLEMMAPIMRAAYRLLQHNVAEHLKIQAKYRQLIEKRPIHAMAVEIFNNPVAFQEEAGYDDSYQIIWAYLNQKDLRETSTPEKISAEIMSTGIITELDNCKLVPRRFNPAMIRSITLEIKTFTIDKDSDRFPHLGRHVIKCYHHFGLPFRSRFDTGARFQDRMEENRIYFPVEMDSSDVAAEYAGLLIEISELPKEVATKRDALTDWTGPGSYIAQEIAQANAILDEFEFTYLQNFLIGSLLEDQDVPF
jgi:hypothetical protein